MEFRNDEVCDGGGDGVDNKVGLAQRAPPGPIENPRVDIHRTLQVHRRRVDQGTRSHRITAALAALEDAGPQGITAALPAIETVNGQHVLADLKVCVSTTDFEVEVVDGGIVIVGTLGSRVEGQNGRGICFADHLDSIQVGHEAIIVAHFQDETAQGIQLGLGSDGKGNANVAGLVLICHFRFDIQIEVRVIEVVRAPFISNTLGSCGPVGRIGRCGRIGPLGNAEAAASVGNGGNEHLAGCVFTDQGD